MEKNYIFTTGTLTINVFVHPEEKDGKKIYHGKSKVATIKNIHQSDVKEALDREIESYLKRCKFKDAERAFSWKFETY